MTRAAALALLALAACVGDAPPVASPDKAIRNDGWVKSRCIDNAPPAGYAGPISPHHGDCATEALPPNVAPAGTFDYSKGLPPRVVR